jgi:VWFA-related protein
MKVKRPWALAAPLLPLLGIGLLEAQAPEPQTPTFEDQVSVGWVMVPVIVRSGPGYARNLDKEDFRLLVDGRATRIEEFERRSDAPASLLVLQDLSGSMANAAKIEMSREAVRFFLDRTLPGDEFAITTFAGGDISTEVPFTADLGALREATEAWTAWGTTALHDAVAWMPEVSLAGRNPKRFALLITDGVDNASKITPEQARDIVRRAQLPTYVLGLGAGNPYELSPEGKKVYQYADVLSLLAATTGGRYFSITGPEDLKTALTAIADDVRHQYVLGFATGEGPSRFRTLRVEVKGKERRTVVFRRGYQGSPPAGSAVGG